MSPKRLKVTLSTEDEKARLNLENGVVVVLGAEKLSRGDMTARNTSRSFAAVAGTTSAEIRSASTELWERKKQLLIAVRVGIPIARITSIPK